jgi:hypothetical protein
MTQFELFSMIFYVLDAAWEESQDPELSKFLSDANPFLFDDIGSADPSVYADFCSKITGPVSIEESYRIAKKYVTSLGKARLEAAFTAINETAWLEGVKEYLQSPHKQ